MKLIKRYCQSPSIMDGGYLSTWNTYVAFLDAWAKLEENTESISELFKSHDLQLVINRCNEPDESDIDVLYYFNSFSLIATGKMKAGANDEQIWPDYRPQIILDLIDEEDCCFGFCLYDIDDLWVVKNVISIDKDDKEYMLAILEEFRLAAMEYERIYKELVELCCRHQCCDYICQPKVTIFNNETAISMTVWDVALVPRPIRDWVSFRINIIFRDNEFHITNGSHSYDYEQVIALRNIRPYKDRNFGSYFIAIVLPTA